MIYQVTSTRQGIERVSNWDGANSNGLNYLEATVIAICAETKLIGNLVKEVNDNYPQPIEIDHLTAKLRFLEKSGLVVCLREVADEQVVKALYVGMEFRLPLIELCQRNRFSQLHLDRIKDELMRKGYCKMEVAFTDRQPLEIRLT